MRRTKILIIGLVLLAIPTLVLLLNTKVQNLIVKLLHHNELKSYKLLAGNGVSSPSYEIKSVINAPLEGPIRFDTLHKVFVISTKKIPSGRHEWITYWKINTNGRIVDSVTVPEAFVLGDDGLIRSGTQYLNWVHTGHKNIQDPMSDSARLGKNSLYTLLKIKLEEGKQFPQISLQRAYFFRRKQKGEKFIILGPNNRANQAKGYEGPAYFDLTYYGETMKFKAYDFEASEGPKSYLYLWGAPKEYENPKIHFLYLPDIAHHPHYSEVGVYVIGPKGLFANAANEHINGFFETNANGQEFTFPDSGQSLRLNMKTFIPFKEVSSYDAIKEDGKHTLSFTFTPRGTAMFKAMTNRNLQQSLALVIQGRIVLAPNISAPILNGKIDIPTHDEEELEYIIELLETQKKQ